MVFRFTYIKLFFYVFIENCAKSSDLQLSSWTKLDILISGFCIFQLFWTCSRPLSRYVSWISKIFPWVVLVFQSHLCNTYSYVWVKLLARLALFFTFWQFDQNVRNSHKMWEYLTFLTRIFKSFLTKSSEILTFCQKTDKVNMKISEQDIMVDYIRSLDYKYRCSAGIISYQESFFY